MDATHLSNVIPSSEIEIRENHCAKLETPIITQPFRILLIKPYQEVPGLLYAPPLGLLSLAATLRESFGDKVKILLEDMKLHHQTTQGLMSLLESFQPDFVAVSALNFEAEASRHLAKIIKSYNSNIITALGGPYALHRGEEILNKSCFDWVFSGAADYTFPKAIARQLCGKPLATDIKGLSYRQHDDSLHINDQQDNIQQLDTLPHPSWDLIDFDSYAKKPNFSNVLKGQRYALLFTSRGCPYLCNYCHDIFSKKFIHQSAERVLDEIAYLYEEKGVDEFQIVDDIFNLHKPRLKKIMSEVIRRWPGELKFTFPNGVRADILDAECIELLAKAGTYYVCIAVETVTERLQVLTEKYLDVDKALWSINEFNKYGVAVSGFFMLGFPGETKEEMAKTVQFALESDLTIAHFFKVMPQPETPLFDLAREENETALNLATEADEKGGSYHTNMSWYELAYEFPLDSYLRWVYLRFYFNPKRIWRIWQRIPKKAILRPAFSLIKVLILKANSKKADYD